MSIHDCRILELAKITDPRGNLTVVEAERHLPFSIRRVFYIYEVPRELRRGGHALKSCHQVLIAPSGSFEVVVDDGRNRRQFTLSQPNHALYIPPMVWREMDHFSAEAVCLVLASEHYDPSDYYRDYEAFLNAVATPPP